MTLRSFSNSVIEKGRATTRPFDLRTKAEPSILTESWLQPYRPVAINLCGKLSKRPACVTNM